MFINRNLITSLYVFLFVTTGCAETETKSESNTESNTESSPSLTIKEQRLQSYASDIAPHYSFEEMTFGEDTAHTLTVYQLVRASTAEINAPDRGMTHFLFFWDDETTAAQQVDFAGYYVYNYWWGDNLYEVSFELNEGDLSQNTYLFELNSKNHTSETTWEGVNAISTETELENSCRFNRELLRFAWEHMEERVGNGECWTLIDEALRSAQAHHAVHYRFGSLITSWYAGEPHDLSSVLPGDVIQFDQASFEGTNGRWGVAGDPNHTALIRSIDRASNYMTVYEQNAPVGGPTTIGSYPLDDLYEGGIYIYRPSPIDGSPQVEYCTNPTTFLHSYEEVENSGHEGTTLQTLPIDEALGGIESCQRTCDTISNCTGFTVENATCSLHQEGSIYSQESSRWFQKIE